ncbi:hypothetical protein GPJ56_007594 [Histomonas meleagridis]|uniref:uncharacterized protein n=1 Tax=Histomonas meleagridis TaxID=135588 RepID=UPI00355A7092|nr:hypothetical protein GPJ56_007594 [Histomonas meleagridis]KAH0806114.1 hypothetical protein GO595_001127 [Histomonas meleagridis]
MINISFDENRISTEQYQPQHGTNQLNRVIDELTKKCDLLITEHNVLAEKNKELHEQIERQERIKALLTVPQFFEIEMKKLQILIDTYSKSLEEIERLSEKTLQAIQQGET